MSEIDINRLDLNLLRAFVILMRERSVTRAAMVLGVGQPAVSHALGRLRHLFDDVLFVRAGRAIEPTQRALVLLDAVTPALEAIEGAVRATARFDPATSSPIFRLGLSDDLQLAILARLKEAIDETVPNATLIVRTTDYRRAAGMLDSGDVSTIIGYRDVLPAQVKTRVIRSARYRALCSGRTKGKLTLDRYCRRDHVLVTVAGDTRGIIDEQLQAMGRSRRVALSLPSFAALPSVLKDSDLIATVPEHLARAFSTEAGLRDHALPFRSPVYAVSMAWRASVDKDPAESWLRQTLLRVVQQAGMTCPERRPP